MYTWNVMLEVTKTGAVVVQQYCSNITHQYRIAGLPWKLLMDDLCVMTKLGAQTALATNRGCSEMRLQKYHTRRLAAGCPCSVVTYSAYTSTCYAVRCGIRSIYTIPPIWFLFPTTTFFQFDLTPTLSSL